MVDNIIFHPSGRAISFRPIAHSIEPIAMPDSPSRMCDLKITSDAMAPVWINFGAPAVRELTGEILIQPGQTIFATANPYALADHPHSSVTNAGAANAELATEFYHSCAMGGGTITMQRGRIGNETHPQDYLG